MSRFLEAVIDLNALSNNLAFVKSTVGKINAKNRIIAIVKADAYGHGAIEVSKKLERDGVDFLGVAFYEEAKALREAGIKSPILLLFDREIEGVIRHNLIPVVFDKNHAKELSRYAKKVGKTIPLHIKVDTGMGRLGLHGDILEQIGEIAKLPNIKIEGIMSHLSMAEEQSWSMEQIERLKNLRKSISSLGLSPMYHISNSEGIFLKEALFDAVRPGIILYGYLLSKNLEAIIPCMTVKTKILDIRKLPKNTPISYGKTFITKRESLIGVIPIGYADGFFRSLSNKGFMIIKGKRAPIVGTVCMDITMVDLSDIPEAKVGDEVIVIGGQGKERITAKEIAEWANTIPYEILTSLGSKAKRKYIN